MIDRIDHFVLNCRKVEATTPWYERALGFRRETYSRPAAPGQRIALRFAQHKFDLRQTWDAPDGNLVEVSHYARDPVA